MAQVELKHVDKSFGSTRVVKDVQLEIEKGEFVVFVGPSGCGKSSWVQAEASEAASLIESSVPHGKPMLAQAQQRLAVLESLKTLQAVAVSHFGPLDDPS